MAKFGDERIRAAVQPYLEPGEQIQYTSRGVQQPNFVLLILMVLFGLVAGLIAFGLLTKNYVMVLTNRRALIIRFSGALKFREFIEYRPGAIPPLTVSQGMIFAVMRISDPAGAMKIKFHRAGMQNNRENAVAIANALGARAA
jgi:hypothetical protein